MADRDVQIKLTTTGDTQAAKAVEKSLEAVAAAEQKVTAAAAESDTVQKKVARTREEAHEGVKRETVATNGAAEAKEGLAKKSINAGYAMQTFGQIVNDAPYGISAVTNQVGQLVSSLGFGAGLAGVLTIAATGVDQVVKHFDIFGTEAAKAAEAARKQADELRSGAIKAREAAAASETARESVLRHEEAMRRLTESYELQIKAIDRAAEARHRDAAAALALANALKESKLAEIAVQEATGELSAVDAERKRQGVERSAGREVEERRRREAQNDVATMADKANAAAAQAIAMKSRARNIGGVEGVMTSEERAAQEARLKEARAAMDAADKEQQAVRDSENANALKGSIPFTGGYFAEDPAERAKRVADAERRKQAAYESAKEASAALARDKAARTQVGGMPAEQVAEEKRKLEQEAQKLEREAADLRQEIQRRKDENERMAKAAGLNIESQSRMSDARIYTIQSREREKGDAELKQERAKESRDEAKEAREEKRKADKEEKDEIRQAKAEAKLLLNSTKTGRSEELQLLLAMMREIVSKTGTMDTETRKHLAELRARVEALGQGK